MAAGFRISPDHQGPRLYVAGLILNIGTGAISATFKVALGVTYRRLNQGDVVVRSTVEQIFTISNGVPFEGGRLTPNMVVPLHYVDEDPQASYDFEMIVDIDGNVSELLSGNNRVIEPNRSFYSPNALQSILPVTFTKETEFKLAR